MGIFTTTVTSNSYTVIDKTIIGTECTDTFVYDISASDGDIIDISLSGNHISEKYISDGIVVPFNEFATSIVFNKSLKLTFAIENSGIAGVFLETLVNIANLTTSRTYEDIATRYEDSPKCGTNGGGNGVNSYDELIDTPNDKIGSANKFIKVNSSENLHEYVNITIADIIDYTAFVPSTLLNDYGFIDNSTQWNTAYGWGDHTLGGYELLINKGIANGYTPLDSNTKVPIQYLPAATLATTFVVNSEIEMLALSTAITGDIAVRTDLSKSFILRGVDPAELTDWQELLAPLGTVTSVNTLNGDVTLNLSLSGGLLGITNGNTVNLDTRYSQQTLTAGANINIDGSNVISATDTTYPIFNNMFDGLVPKRIGASETRYLREDGNWETPIAGPTYLTNTLAQLNTGADTVGKLQTSKNLNDWLNSKSYSTQTLVAGLNISITGNTISAIDTTYTVGTLSQLNDATDLIGRLQTSKNLNDWLTSKGYITDYTVTQGDVTQHEAALTITESQISDLNHFSGSYNDLTDVPAVVPDLVTSVNTKVGDVVLYELDVVGKTQFVNSGTGTVVVEYNNFTQFNLNQSGNTIININNPTLEIGESASRIMYLEPNGFDITFPIEFSSRVSGFEFLDITKENWIVTRYTRTDTGIKQFSNLTVFPFDNTVPPTDNIMEGGAYDTDYTLLRVADGGTANTVFTLIASGGDAYNN